VRHTASRARRVSLLASRPRATMGAMTDLVARARASAARGGDTPRPLATASALAAAWAAGAGLLLCTGVALAGWFVGSTGTGADAVRVGVQAWLLGQGSGLRVGSATVTALPLGLTALSAALLYRAGRWAASTAQAVGVRAVASGTAVETAVFATVAMTAALLTATASAAVSPVRAFVCAAVPAAAFSGLGMLSGAGLLDTARDRLPEHLRAGLHGALAALLATLAGGALLASAALAADLGDAVDVARATGAGAVGGAILTLAGVLLLPNAALLGVAYMLGPGFAFGAGTTVSSSGVRLGEVPALPLLAALPDDGPAPAWAVVLLAVPVLTGALGAVVALRHHPVAGLDQAALRGGLAGLLGGVATGTSTALAGGAVGPGRMAETGADVGGCVLAATVAMALGGALAGLLVCWRARRAG
jgi:Family of unknown function (DUF6350)